MKTFSTMLLCAWLLWARHYAVYCTPQETSAGGVCMTPLGTGTVRLVDTFDTLATCQAAATEAEEQQAATRAARTAGEPWTGVEAVLRCLPSDIAHPTDDMLLPH